MKRDSRAAEFASSDGGIAVAGGDFGVDLFGVWTAVLGMAPTIEEVVTNERGVLGMNGS